MISRDELLLEQAKDVHRDSGLWDETLAERYARNPDLVALVDETHRNRTDPDAGYYALSAVVFHADDLPALRRAAHEIAQGSYWHAKDFAKSPCKSPRIAQLNAYAAKHSALPVTVFQVKLEQIDRMEERAVRDQCLTGLLKHLNEEGIYDVVADSFPASLAHEQGRDQYVLEDLRAQRDVDARMWLYHARMGEEPALWVADSVAWSMQRHYFGEREGDSAHLAPSLASCARLKLAPEQHALGRAPARRMLPFCRGKSVEMPPWSHLPSG